MPRLMSVAFTEHAVVDRTKTVTRRKGWMFLKPGDRLTLCRKVMGRKAGEPLVRLAEVEVLAVRREALARVVRQGELEKEGFPFHRRRQTGVATTGDFIRKYFEPQGLSREDMVTRIEWRYLDTNQKDN